MVCWWTHLTEDGLKRISNTTINQKCYFSRPHKPKLSMVIQFSVALHSWLKGYTNIIKCHLQCERSEKNHLYQRTCKYFSEIKIINTNYILHQFLSDEPILPHMAQLFWASKNPILFHKYWGLAQAEQLILNVLRRYLWYGRYGQIFFFEIAFWLWLSNLLLKRTNRTISIYLCYINQDELKAHRDA